MTQTTDSTAPQELLQALSISIEVWERGVRLVSPHVPAARQKGTGWRPACAHCSVLDEEPTFVHDDQWEAADDALVLLAEHVHGPAIDRPGTE